ncbi:MAG: ATP-binding protein [Bryobacteraceae bacterium]|jgi:two-component system, NtrC family, sensor kinase
MNEPHDLSGDPAFWVFLDDLKNNLRAVREDQNALRLCLRRACEYFKVDDGCIATATRQGSQAELITVTPRRATWDLDLLAAFLQKRRPRIPPNVIMGPIQRRGRLWGVLALRGEHEFRIPTSYIALRRIANLISEAIEVIDRERNIEVRSQIDRKILEQLRPRDLFYQILHGLRSLTRYDHSSSLLICDPRENVLEVVAEQIAWFKGKSRRIGLKLPLTDDIWALLRKNMVYGFNLSNAGWEEWSNGKSKLLAELLDYNKAPEASTADRRESCMLCAPLTGREGVMGLLKVAARYPGAFSGYEVDLVQRFTPLAAVAIQNSQRTVTLETKMLEAEKKHAIANLLRGVSHDVNNALGCILPLVQQIQVDIPANGLQPETLSGDLQQIEQSIQICRRIFGGMLALARNGSQSNFQGNVRRALDSTLAVLRDAFERQGIRLDIQFPDVLPNIQAGQGDMEQLFLNLVTNARDAMPSGGVLSIRAENDGEQVAILIRDTGCGIPVEFMSRIQEPFFTTKKNGNGLGLSICRSIVWNAGGQMEISSEPGAGTRIRVLLPSVGAKKASGAI